MTTSIIVLREHLSASANLIKNATSLDHEMALPGHHLRFQINRERYNTLIARLTQLSLDIVGGNLQTIEAAKLLLNETKTLVSDILATLDKEISAMVNNASYVINENNTFDELKEIHSSIPLVLADAVLIGISLTTVMPGIMNSRPAPVTTPLTAVPDVTSPIEVTSGETLSDDSYTIVPKRNVTRPVVPMDAKPANLGDNTDLAGPVKSSKVCSDTLGDDIPPLYRVIDTKGKTTEVVPVSAVAATCPVKSMDNDAVKPVANGQVKIKSLDDGLLKAMAIDTADSTAPLNAFQVAFQKAISEKATA